MRMVLERLDYRVSCVASGAAALAAIADRPYDLVMIALQLPDIPALALTRRLCRESSGRQPSLLVFGSAWDEAAVAADCRSAGARLFLPKPISIGWLVAAVHRLVQPAPEIDRGPVEAPLEARRLAALADGDERLERELTALYLSSASHYVDELSLALEEGRDWSAAAHALMGASAGFGARVLADLAARAATSPPSRKALADIHSGLDALRASLADRRVGWGSGPMPAAL